jgi:Ca-activated chloride channel homolog
MSLTKKRKCFAPALVLTTLALFSCTAVFFGSAVSAQKIRQLPAPPPVPVYKPKPTPTPEPIEYEVVRVTSNLVMVPVSVTDARGEPVLGLKASDFHIEENGRAQTITQIGNPEQVPLDIALLVDVSGSVVSRFSFEQQAAASFLQQVLKPEDRATVLAIDQTPRMIQELTSAQVAAQKVMTITPANGYTAFFDSVLTAASYINKSSGTGRRRIAVVISDGDDTARIIDVSTAKSSPGNLQLVGTEAQLALNKQAVLDTLREVQRAEITFYSINPSGKTLRLNVRTARGEEGMERISAATGGASFIPGDDSELRAIFQRIAAEIRTQYLIQYYSNNESAGREFRRINVTAPAQAQLRVRTREGYFPKGN